MGTWAAEIEAVGARIGGRFARSEPRRRALGYVRGLLSGTERKNGWHLAEYLGDPTPDGAQHLLARAGHVADAVRDDRIGYVAEHLGDPGGVVGTAVGPYSRAPACVPRLLNRIQAPLSGYDTPAHK